MNKGEIMIYAGIGLILAAIILFLVFGMVFRRRKKKMIEGMGDGA